MSRPTRAEARAAILAAANKHRLQVINDRMRGIDRAISRNRRRGIGSGPAAAAAVNAARSGSNPYGMRRLGEAVCVCRRNGLVKPSVLVAAGFNPPSGGAA